MEVTNEIKAKIYALYIGSHVIWGLERYNMPLRGVCVNSLYVSPKYDNNYFREVPMNGSQLILKSLSSITDEDAIEVAKIAYGNGYAHYKTRKVPILFEKKIIGYYKEVLCIPENKNTTWLTRYVHIPLYDMPEEAHMIGFGNVNPDSSLTPVFRYFRLTIEILDFLRSKGYMLPAYGIQNLFTAGIAINAKSYKTTPSTLTDKNK